MIRINLLGEKVDKRGIYLLQVLAYFSALAVVCFACFLFHENRTTTLELTRQDRKVLEVRLEKAKKRTQKVAGLQQKEELLHEKLMVITRLKAKKQGPVRVLDELTRAMPKRSWLQGLEQKENRLEFVGVAFDNRTISEFMDNLNRLPYFYRADLSYSEQEIRRGVETMSFKLYARLRSLLKVAKNKKKRAAAKEAAQAAEASKSDTAQTEDNDASEGRSSRSQDLNDEDAADLSDRSSAGISEPGSGARSAGSQLSAGPQVSSEEESRE